MNRILSRLTGFAVMIIFLFSFVPFGAYAEGENAPNVKITDYTKPEGKLETGQFFVLKGIITSEEPIKNVIAGIYYRNGVANQEIISEVNKTEFDIKTIDSDIHFGILPEGLYCYQVGVTDNQNNYTRLVYSEFQVGEPDTKSEIKAEDSHFPSEVMEYGKSFKINCNITSVQPLYKVSAYINKSDNSVWKVTKHSVNSKNYTFSGDDIFDVAELDEGTYTYRLVAEDYSGYNVTLEKLNFEVKKSADTDSDIKISGAVVPSGVVKQGTYFNLRGTITSKYKMTTVTSKIISKSDNKVLQQATFRPNSTTFSVFPDIDYSMIFNKLNTGKYTYLIEVEDEKNYKVNIVESDFEIGESNIMPGDANIDKKVDIADVVAIAGYIADSENNFLQPVGIKNGDVQDSGNGLNASDALMIQQYLANVITTLK